VRKNFEIYNPDEVVQLIMLGVATIDEAAEYACSSAEVRAWGLGKRGLWKDLWGRRVRR
jgi:hypothetical protein